MFIKNGKFHNEDGQMVPIQIGNKEQIDCLNQSLKRLSELEQDNALSVSYEVEEVLANVGFTCVCGIKIFRECEDTYELIDRNITCYKCKTKYIIIEKDNGDLGLEILNKNLQ